jgi:Recombinase zinc beta ribbon domain
LPSCISVEQYERNMRRMDANRSRARGMGAVRDGPALLAGLVRCGRCGRKMTVRYQRGPGGAVQPSYACGMAAATWAEERCRQLAGPRVDDCVSGLALQAMAPAALEISLAAAEQEQQRRAETDRIWRQRLERADYAADRARRQYQLAEPENRLVVRQLEKDWNDALAERQRLGEDYDRHLASRPRALTAAEREQIQALAADLPAVWNAETTTDADRKQLLRHLIENVTVTVVRRQRAGRRRGHLGRRPPHHGPRHPPGRDPGPAELPPPAPAAHRRTARRRVHDGPDRRQPQRRAAAAAQARHRLHPELGPRPARRTGPAALPGSGIPTSARRA